MRNLLHIFINFCFRHATFAHSYDSTVFIFNFVHDDKRHFPPISAGHKLGRSSDNIADHLQDLCCTSPYHVWMAVAFDRSLVCFIALIFFVKKKNWQPLYFQTFPRTYRWHPELLKIDTYKMYIIYG